MRLRTFTILFCLSAAVFLTGVLVLSLFRSFIWRDSPYDRFGLDWGRVFVVVEWWGNPGELVNASGNLPGWFTGWHNARFPFDAVLLQPHSMPFWGGTLLSFPLWIPIMLLLIPPAILALRRRPLPGTCRCGYDLTGNVSERCPECGAACSAGVP